MFSFDEKDVISRVIGLRTAFCGPRGKNRFAAALGISASTYNYYENDRLPPVAILLKICEVTGTDIRWLLTGQSGDVLKACDDPFLAKVSELIQKHPDLRGGLNAFLDLYVQSIQAQTQAWPVPSPDNAHNNNAHCQSNRSVGGWIPVIGRTAAGMVHFWDQVQLPKGAAAITELDQLVLKYTGKEIASSQQASIDMDMQTRSYLRNLSDLKAGIIQINGSDLNEPCQFVDCSQIKEAFPDSFALQIDGDSMASRIKDGDVVVLSPSVSACQGQIAIVKLAGQIGVTCKLVRFEGDRLHLIPLNEKYEPQIVPASKLMWALAVLCHINV